MVTYLANINSYWGYLIVEELARNKITYFCISPGSRSTPLTVAAAGNRSVKNIIIFDERGAAFHALGYARATGIPAVLLCTSGTATANYLPAIIEAHQSCIPLVVITADRPPELRGTTDAAAPPQMIILLPVHTAEWVDRGDGVFKVEVGDQASVNGLYLPPQPSG